ncbi:dipeptidase, partial [Streptococcus suis]
EAFKNRSASYDTNSWYWTVQNIDNMAISHPELFGTSIQEKWIAHEKEWIASQAALDDQYAGLSEDAAVDLAPTVTEA